MKRRACKLIGSHKGFTLVELVIVIALMAIMAAFVVPAFTNLRRQAGEEERQEFFADVKLQAKDVVDAYKNALDAAETPRYAGYNISTARGMQECLRAANNHAEVYDIVVTTVATEPNIELYNYVDTIVVCVQFYGLTPEGNDVLLTLDGTPTGTPCSPEFCPTFSPKKCALAAIWYVRVEDDGTTVKKGDGWQ